MSNGDFSIFFTRPISLVLLIISFLMLFYPMINDYFKKRKVEKQISQLKENGEELR
ncbi:hypothetical protein ACI2OX_04515 [Bacillus sp. N9]